MSYVLNGVTVSVAPQALRPREPPRPGVAVTMASPLVATRAPRPRSDTAPTALTTSLLQNVTNLKGQQVALEKKLAVVAVDLRTANGNAQAAQAQGHPAVQVLVAKATAVQTVANTVITQIKAVAAKANDAAAGAIQAGATRAEVIAAADKAQPAIALTSTPSGIAPGLSPMVVALAPTERKVVVEAPATFTGQPGLVTSNVVVPSQGIAPPQVRVPSNPGANVSSSTTTGPTSANNVAVESNTAALQPNGTITVGPDAQLVTTPALTEPAQPLVAAPSNVGTWLLLGLGGFLGYRYLKKKGVL